MNTTGVGCENVAGGMVKAKRRQVSRGRRGSNEAKLVLVDVASGKTRNLGSPSIPHAEAGSFASWILLEPYAIRGRLGTG